MANLSYVGVSRLIDLLKSVEVQKNMFVSILSTNKLALGVDPLAPTILIDLSKEKVIPFQEMSPIRSPNVYPTMEVGAAVSTEIQSSNFSHLKGNAIEFRGEKEVFRSQKVLLAQTLVKLENFRPGTFEKLTKIKPRSRRIVSKSRNLLFDNPKLMNHSEILIGEWWMNTNNSADQVKAWLERACECAGLKWNVDLKVRLA